MCFGQLSDRRAVNTHCLMRLRGGWSACGSYRLMSHFFCLTCVHSAAFMGRSKTTTGQREAQQTAEVRSAALLRKINEEIISGAPLKALRNQTGGSDLWPEGGSYLRGMEKCLKHFSTHSVITMV